MKALTTLITIVLVLFVPQWVRADSIQVKFANDQDAESFVQTAHNNGQGHGAVIVRNDDGSLSVTLPEIATDNMSEIAMGAIADHAMSIDIGPSIPTEVKTAISTWFDGFISEGNTTMHLTAFTDAFEYEGCFSNAAIGIDRSFLGADLFFFRVPRQSVLRSYRDLPT